MSHRVLQCLVALGLCVGTVLPSLAETFRESPLDAQTIHAVQQGGYVLYLRHGITDSAIPDQVPVDLNDCSTQRPLTTEGRKQMAFIGQSIAQAGFPVGEIYVSPFCRAIESAQAAFGEREIVVEELLKYTAAMTRVEKTPVIQRTRELVSLPVTTAGKNRALVAHGPNMAEIMNYFPPEGTLVVVRPLGADSFEYVGSVRPEQWDELLLPPPWQ
ncbi:histidine phosphatase family protein [Chrysiogenes arsenatis]|uniref:histidine phosphatase family protein n=1 Tax=Chrysiogenes arsenatis TaxID=309797 RepID=UPI00041F1935|nr:histidine phosphatase family protein [Chrysiogenes arsenatis]